MGLDLAEEFRNGVAWSQLARLYTGLGLAGCALDVAGRAIAVSEHDATAWYWYAAALANWGDYDEAARALERAETLEGAPHDEIRAYLQLKRGDLDGGLVALDHIVEEDGEPELWVVLDERAFHRARRRRDRIVVRLPGDSHAVRREQNPGG